MRPQAIVTFERLSLLSILLSVVQLAMVSSEDGGGATWLAVGAIPILVSIALVLLASRKASNVARWILTVLTLAGLAWTGFEVGRDFARGVRPDVGTWIGIAALLLQAGAVGLLFNPVARGWFAGRDELKV